VSGLSIIAIPLAIAAVVLLLGFVGCDWVFGITEVHPVPDVTTSPATDISSHGATLQGTVNPEGQATTYHFEYGPTPAYGTSTASMSAGSGSADVTATPALISDLVPGTSYYFALTAATGGHVFPGVQLTFSTRQPLGFWPLNEGGGSIAFDTSPNQFNGTYHGGVTHVPDLQGAGGNAASFDGTGYVEVPFHAALNPPSFHIDVLAKVTAAPAGTYGTVISTLDGASFTGYAIYAGPTNKWELWLGDGSPSSVQSSAAITSTVDVVPGQIVALSASYDANAHEVTLIVTPDSGAVKQTSTIGYMPNQAAPLRIASDYTQGDFFSGALADVEVSPL
jgi:hypothetical protein